MPGEIPEDIPLKDRLAGEVRRDIHPRLEVFLPVRDTFLQGSILEGAPCRIEGVAYLLPCNH